jgi:hypothetical protein
VSGHRGFGARVAGQDPDAGPSVDQCRLM